MTARIKIAPSSCALLRRGFEGGDFEEEAAERLQR
jgi:hypothetical protein